MALIIVAGASGQHAAVVHEAALGSGANVLGFATIESTTPAPMIDCRWLGSVRSIAPMEIARGTQFIVACGSDELRERLREALLSQGACLQSVCHTAAIMSPSASIAPGSALLAGAIVGPRAALGHGVIVNHGASVDHDCEVGAYGNIGPGARLAGCVAAEQGVFVGLNASVLHGAGAVVTRNVAPGETVVGIPARPLRKS